MRCFCIVALCSLSVLSANAQHAADAYFDPDAMAQARAALRANHGEQVQTLLMAERFEIQSSGGRETAVWEGQGWVGGDIQKLWIKTEGDYVLSDGAFDEVEVQALYSRAIAPFWDLQIGVRHNSEPGPSRTYAVVGAQGLAPYWFELDAAIFLSDQGDASARIEAEYEFRLSQRWLLQPRAELAMAFSDDAELGVGSGVATLEAGLRLRYEIRRKFAPYIGYRWSNAYGSTVDYRRLQGDGGAQSSWVAGMRLWF